MTDETWVALRYLLIAAGSFLVGAGKVTSSEVTTLVDQFIALASGAVTLGAALWGIYVRWNTKAVPAETAARADVPTVSSVTGKVQ